MTRPEDRPEDVEDVARKCLEVARQTVETVRRGDHLQRGVTVGDPHLRGRYPDTVVVIDVDAPKMGPGPVEYPIWTVDEPEAAPRMVFWTHDIFVDLIEAR